MPRAERDFLMKLPVACLPDEAACGLPEPSVSTVPSGGGKMLRCLLRGMKNFKTAWIKL